MATVIIAHGVTPTGVGIRLRSNGTLRPLSPCCGQRMLNPAEKPRGNTPCKGCGKEYASMETTLGGTLGNDIPLNTHNTVMKNWLELILGLEGIEFSTS